MELTNPAHAVFVAVVFTLTVVPFVVRAGAAALAGPHPRRRRTPTILTTPAVSAARPAPEGPPEVRGETPPAGPSCDDIFAAALSPSERRELESRLYQVWDEECAATRAALGELFARLGGGRAQVVGIDVPVADVVSVAEVTMSDGTVLVLRCADTAPLSVVADRARQGTAVTIDRLASAGEQAVVVVFATCAGPVRLVAEHLLSAGRSEI